MKYEHLKKSEMLQNTLTLFAGDTMVFSNFTRIPFWELRVSGSRAGHLQEVKIDETSSEVNIVHF